MSIPWNKGRHLSKETIEKMRNAKRGKNYRLGWKMPDDLKKKLSLAHKGQVPWNKGTKGICKAWNKGKKLNPLSLEHRNKISEGLRKQPREYIVKRLQRKEKTCLEIKFEEIIQKLNLPYKFVGNGQFLIENKCPDFINCNGQKIAIEVFYKGHKDFFRGGIEQWKRGRQEVFSKYGWRIEFFDEADINEEEIKRRLLS